jgi:predicted RNA-binding Zn-ribbon protein involved in translation (DUF1610 family)
MVICPKCGNEIEYLGLEVISKIYYTFDKNGEWNYVDEGDVDTIFYCPKCQKTLLFDEEDALAFLNGEKVEVAQDDE